MVLLSVRAAKLFGAHVVVRARDQIENHPGAKQGIGHLRIQAGQAGRGVVSPQSRVVPHDDVLNALAPSKKNAWVCPGKLVEALEGVRRQVRVGAQI